MKPSESGTLFHDIYPDKVEIAFQLADALSRGGDNADRSRAIAIYDSIEAVEGPSLALSSNKIQLYFNENDTAAVLSEADRLRQASPGNADFQVFSGKVYSMFGRGDEALRFFDRACELDPSSGLAYYPRLNTTTPSTTLSAMTARSSTPCVRTASTSTPSSPS